MFAKMVIRSLAVAGALASTSAYAADPVSGRWVTESKNAVVSIADCGGSTCGTITKLLVTPPDGANQRDINNPDKAKRNRKLLGMPVLTGFSKDGDQWRGTIYDPNTGKSYRSILRRKSSNVLEVKGCVGPFCQTQIWRRAP